MSNELVMDFTKIHEGNLRSFPVVREFRDDEFDKLNELIKSSKETIMGVIDGNTIVTTRCIGYSIPQNYIFRVSKEDNTVKISLRNSNDVSTDIYHVQLLGTRFIIKPLVNEINPFLYEMVDFKPIDEIINTSDKYMGEEPHRIVDVFKTVTPIKYINISKLYDLGYDVTNIWTNILPKWYYTRLEGSNNKLRVLSYISKYSKDRDISCTCCIYDDSTQKIEEVLNIIDKKKKSFAATKDIDELLITSNIIPQQQIIQQQPTAQTIPVPMSAVNYHNPDKRIVENDAKISPASMAKNLSLIENGHMPLSITSDNKTDNQNNIIDTIVNRINGIMRGRLVYAEHRQDGLINIKLVQPNRFNLIGGITIDVNSVTLDPRFKWYPKELGELNSLEHYKIPAYSLMDDKNNIIGLEFICQCLTNGMIGIPPQGLGMENLRLYNDYEQMVLPMFVSNSILCNNMPNKQKTFIIRKIIKALANKNVMAEIQKYQKKPLFVCNKVSGSTSFSIYSTVDSNNTDGQTEYVVELKFKESSPGNLTATVTAFIKDKEK